MTLEGLLRLYRDCDPIDCDCDTCPLSQRIELTAGDTIDLSFNICSIFREIEDWLKEQQ